MRTGGPLVLFALAVAGAVHGDAHAVLALGPALCLAAVLLLGLHPGERHLVRSRPKARRLATQRARSCGVVSLPHGLIRCLSRWLHGRHLARRPPPPGLLHAA